MPLACKGKEKFIESYVNRERGNGVTSKWKYEFLEIALQSSEKEQLSSRILHPTSSFL